MTEKSTKKRVEKVPEKKSRVRKNEETKQSTERVKKVKYRRRRFPILLRILVVLLLLAISLAVGLAFGYGILGDGSMLDIFKKETWQHIIDIVELEK